MKIFGDTPQEHKKALLELAPLWLARSGHHPLSIDTVDLCDPSLSSALLEHRARWEHLALSRAGTHLLNTTMGSMPLLQSLKLRYLRRISLTSSRNLLPHLRAVLLDDCMVKNLPWSQLTVVAHTALVECSLYPWDRHVSHSDVADVMLLGLERLSLQPGGHFDDNFFTSLVTPSLVKLELPEIVLRARYPDPIDSLNIFIAKSGCTLQELEIRQAVLPTEVYHDAFPRIPIIAVGILPVLTGMIAAWLGIDLDLGFIPRSSGIYHYRLFQFSAKIRLPEHLALKVIRSEAEATGAFGIRRGVAYRKIIERSSSGKVEMGYLQESRCSWMTQFSACGSRILRTKSAIRASLFTNSKSPVRCHMSSVSIAIDTDGSKTRTNEILKKHIRYEMFDHPKLEEFGGRKIRSRVLPTPENLPTG
ncbi:hypothetical protein R3P38DRAFT_2809532 [Favolaschia claudopus]|uniref:Uncharacterized protein n=1 Tax=Favolaschia claudopus TaxID=2862362 RepID=A0AAV9ZDF9_9AGAR